MSNPDSLHPFLSAILSVSAYQPCHTELHTQLGVRVYDEILTPAVLYMVFYPTMALSDPMSRNEILAVIDQSICCHLMGTGILAHTGSTVCYGVLCHWGFSVVFKNVVYSVCWRGHECCSSCSSMRPNRSSGFAPLKKWCFWIHPMDYDQWSFSFPYIHYCCVCSRQPEVLQDYSHPWYLICKLSSV